MASYPYPEHEEDEYYDDEGEEQRDDGDNDCHEDYDYWSLYSDEEEEEEEEESDEDEDEDEEIPLIGEEDEGDVGNENVDGDEEEEGAYAMEIDGAEGEHAEEIADELGTERAAEFDRSDSSSCPICFKPWTADGPHRVCCPPCGHVHGRSCLETWLQLCGETNGKCPQCNRKFRHPEIINLYAPLNMFPNDSLDKIWVRELSSWKSKGSTSGQSHLFSSNPGEVRHGCAHCSELQERVTDMEAQMSQLGSFQNYQLTEFQNEVANLRYEVVVLKSEMAEMNSEMVEVAELQDEIARLKSEVTEMRNQMIDVVDLQGETDDLKSKMTEMSSEMTEMRRMFAEMTGMQNEMQFAKRRHPTTADGGASCSVRQH